MGSLWHEARLTRCCAISGTGLLEQFEAVVVARARATDDAERLAGRRAPSDDERRRYRADQQDAVLRAVEAYRLGTMGVVGVDFGHTSPQWVLPCGGTLTVDGPARRIVARY